MRFKDGSVALVPVSLKKKKNDVKGYFCPKQQCQDYESTLTAGLTKERLLLYQFVTKLVTPRRTHIVIAATCSITIYPVLSAWTQRHGHCKKKKKTCIHFYSLSFSPFFFQYIYIYILTYRVKKKKFSHKNLTLLCFTLPSKCSKKKTLNT